MHESHVIDVDGVFVGAAIHLKNGYRFVAVDHRLDDINGTFWPSREDVQRVARRIVLTGHPGNLPKPHSPPP
jgi:hypothetical protein